MHQIQTSFINTSAYYQYNIYNRYIPRGPHSSFYLWLHIPFMITLALMPLSHDLGCLQFLIFISHLSSSLSCHFSPPKHLSLASAPSSSTLLLSHISFFFYFLSFSIGQPTSSFLLLLLSLLH